MQYVKDLVTCIDCFERVEVSVEVFDEWRFFTCPVCGTVQEVFDDPVIITLDDDTATVAGGGWWMPGDSYHD